MVKRGVATKRVFMIYVPEKCLDTTLLPSKKAYRSPYRQLTGHLTGSLTGAVPGYELGMNLW